MPKTTGGRAASSGNAAIIATFSGYYYNIRVLDVDDCSGARLQLLLQNGYNCDCALCLPWAGRRQAQRGKAHLLPIPWKCCKVFCASVVTAKRSADELFMQYFTTCRRLVVAWPQTPTRAPSRHPTGDFQTLNFTTPGNKIPHAPIVFIAFRPIVHTVRLE